jgi:hypothetical protein
MLTAMVIPVTTCAADYRGAQWPVDFQYEKPNNA